MSPWKSDGRIAELQLPELYGKILLSDPQAGIEIPSGKSDPFKGASFQSPSKIQILGVRSATRSPMRLIDSHVRGNDLIACYEDEASHEFRREVYWRVRQAHVPVCIEVVVGIQTRRLDSHSSVFVESIFPKTDLQHCFLPDDLSLVQLKNICGKNGYAEMSPQGLDIFPTVCNEAHRDNFVTKIRWLVVDEPMEKGVIRVGRVMGVWMPSTMSTSELTTLQADYSESEIPLTA